MKNHPLDNDLGLGNQLVGAYRMVDKNGKFRVKRKGTSVWHPYNALLKMSWTAFHVVIFAFYTVVNAIFAFLYVMIGENALSGEYFSGFYPQYTKCFFFSVQTLTTVGYGAISPNCFWSNTIAAIEALIGLLIFALVTGLYYAKFTRPVSKIRYSEKMLFSPYKEDTNGLMFRMVNQRSSQLIDLEVQVTFSWVETSNEGSMTRRFQGLSLERSKIMLFPLNFTVVHPITTDSLLYGKTLDDLMAIKAEFLVFVKGHDVDFGQQIQSSISYQTHDMSWAKKFVPMYTVDENEGSVIDLDKISEVIDRPLAPYKKLG
jgi:inward rectifier potassium channel